MSTQYDYYLGYLTKEGVFETVAPFEKRKNCDETYTIYEVGQMNSSEEFVPLSVYWHTGSYKTDIVNRFWKITDINKLGEDFRKIVSIDKNGDLCTDIRFAEFSEIESLSRNGYIQTAYVDKETVNAYELSKSRGEDFEYFCEWDFDSVAPIVYAELDEKERKKYMRYSWIAHNSAEYVACRLVDAFRFLQSEWKIPDECKPVVLLTVL